VFVRSIKAWVWIAVAMMLIACVVLGILTLLAKHSDLARVPVRGSNLTLVLYQDEKGLHRYDVLAGRNKVARDVLLGSRGALAAEPQVAVLGDHVTITFYTADHAAPFVEFDLAACRITQHSNQAQPPPAIARCRRL
jgi:hypothetical protein